MLENIRIASPCKANWEQMAGDERVRHCAECDLDVYNFSAMTRREVEHLVQEREGRLCARFYRRADGSMLTQDCPVGFRARVRRVSRVAGAAIAAALSVVPAWAQDAKPKSPLVQIEPDETALVLHVMEANGAVIVKAQVSILPEGSKHPLTGETDTNGHFNFAGVQPGKYHLVVSAPGFETFDEHVTIAGKTKTEREVRMQAVAVFEMGILAVPELQVMPLDTPELAPAKIPYVPMPRSFPKK